MPQVYKDPVKALTPFRANVFRCGELGHFKRKCNARRPRKNCEEPVSVTVVVQATDGALKRDLNWKGQQ